MVEVVAGQVKMSSKRNYLYANSCLEIVIDVAFLPDVRARANLEILVVQSLTCMEKTSYLEVVLLQAAGLSKVRARAAARTRTNRLGWNTTM